MYILNYLNKMGLLKAQSSFENMIEVLDYNIRKYISIYPAGKFDF